jgi:hypothetical protein
MPEPRLIEAAHLADLADRLAARLGPAILAEDAPEPDPLTLAAWHAMNALQRVAELVPGGRLAGEPDARLASLTDLAGRGEGIVQAALDSLIAEGRAAPVVERPGDRETASAPERPETVTVQMSFLSGEGVSLALERDARSGNLLHATRPGASVLKQLDPATRQVVTAAVAELAHVLITALADGA